jgi:predicted alpha/beta superfamily hydrolase
VEGASGRTTSFVMPRKLLSRLFAELLPPAPPHPPEEDDRDDASELGEDRMQLSLPLFTPPETAAPATLPAVVQPAAPPAPAARWRSYAEVYPPPRHQTSGQVRVLEDVASPELGNRRNLLVYLPPSYQPGGRRRFPVLYLHDGQNTFDPATSFAGEWGADETMETLAAEHGLEAILVALPNTPDRLAEYSPFVDPRHGGGRGDAYLRFLTDTVKPLVDRELATLPGPQSTGTLGASMGGLISLYALHARPDVFGFAGAMSPSLFFAREAIFPWLARHGRAGGKLYLDVGTLEGFRRLWNRLSRGALPSDAVRRTRRLVWLLERQGFERGRNLLYVEERGARHHEAAWARRLPRALRFLLRGTGAKNGRPRG